MTSCGSKILRQFEPISSFMSKFLSIFISGTKYFHCWMFSGVGISSDATGRSSWENNLGSVKKQKCVAKLSWLQLSGITQVLTSVFDILNQTLTGTIHMLMTWFMFVDAHVNPVLSALSASFYLISISDLLLSFFFNCKQCNIVGYFPSQSLYFLLFVQVMKFWLSLISREQP